MFPAVLTHLFPAVLTHVFPVSQVTWSREQRRSEMQSLRDTILTGKRAKLEKQGRAVDDETLQKEVRGVCACMCVCRVCVRG